MMNNWIKFLTSFQDKYLTLELVMMTVWRLQCPGGRTVNYCWLMIKRYQVQNPRSADFDFCLILFSRTRDIPQNNGRPRRVVKQVEHTMFGI